MNVEIRKTIPSVKIGGSMEREGRKNNDEDLSHPNQWRAKWDSASRAFYQDWPHRSTYGSRRNIDVMRSSQMDALRLDDELASLLKEQLKRAIALIPTATLSKLDPEINLIFHGLILVFSVWEGRQLPGMKLMNLRFRNEKAMKDDSYVNRAGINGVEGPLLSRKQRAYFFLAIAIKYLWGRLSNLSISPRLETNSSTGTRALKFIRIVEGAYNLCSLGNFLAFISGLSNYRSLFELWIQSRVVYRQPTAPRAVSYEYLNRQLVWSELGEVLLFLLPLVNSDVFKQAIRSVFPRLPSLFSQNDFLDGVSQRELDSSTVIKQNVEIRRSICGICGKQDIIDPYLAKPCNHEFCYFCLRSHGLAQPVFKCPICLSIVDAMQPAWKINETTDQVK